MTSREYYQKKPWVKYLHRAKRRCMDERYWSYKYYGAKGIRCFLSKEQMHFLWKRDKAFEMKKPSIDRIDPKGDYVLSNCRFIEMLENIGRAHRKWGICIELGCTKKGIRLGKCSSHSMKDFRRKKKAMREGLA